MHHSNNTRSPAPRPRYVRGRFENMSPEHSLRFKQMAVNSSSFIQKRTQEPSEIPWPNLQPSALEPGLPSTSGVNEVPTFSGRNALPGSSRESRVGFPIAIKEENMEEVPFPGSRGEHEFLKEDNMPHQKRSQKSREKTTANSSTSRSRNRQSYRVPISHFPSSMSPQVLLAEVRRTQQSTDINYQALSSEVNIARHNSVCPQGYHRRCGHRINVAHNTYPRTNEFLAHSHSSYFRNISPLVPNDPPLFVQQASKLRRGRKVYESFHNIHGISDKYSVNQQFIQNAYRPLFAIHRQPEQNYFIGYQPTNNGCHMMQNPFAQAILQQLHTNYHAQFYQQQIARQELYYCNTFDQNILSHNHEEELESPETSRSYITNPAQWQQNDFSGQSTSNLANISHHLATIENDENHATYEHKFSNLEVSEINEKNMQIPKEQLYTYKREISEQTPPRENTEYEQKPFEFKNNTCYIQTYGEDNIVEPEGSPIQPKCEYGSNVKVKSELVDGQENIIHDTQNELNKDASTNETDDVVVHKVSLKPIVSVDSCSEGPDNTNNSDEGNSSPEITVISGASSEAEEFVAIATSSKRPQTEPSHSVFIPKPNVVGDSGELKETGFAEFSAEPDIFPSIGPLIQEENVFLLSAGDIEQAKVLGNYKTRDFPYMISDQTKYKVSPIPEMSHSNVETVLPEVPTGSDIFPSIEILQEQKNVVLLSIDGIKQAEVVDNSGFQASPRVLLEQAIPEVPPPVNPNLTPQHQCIVPFYTQCVPQANVLANYTSQVAYYELLEHALSETSISLPPEQHENHVLTVPDEQFCSSSGVSEQYLPGFLNVAGTSASILPPCCNNQPLFLLPPDPVAMANEPPAGDSENLGKSFEDLLTLQDMPLLERKVPSVFSFDDYEMEDLAGLDLTESLDVDVKPLIESPPNVPLQQVPLFTDPVPQIKGLPPKEEPMDTDSDVKHPPFKTPKKANKNIKLKTNGTRKSHRIKRIPERLFYIQKGLQF